MAKLFFFLILCVTFNNSFALEKCTFKLDPEYFKIGLNFYTDDERLEQKGYFSKVEIKGKLFNNSLRGIVNDLEVFIPFKNLNTYDTVRDRMVYNYLLKNNKNNQETAHIKVKTLERKTVLLTINLNNIVREVKFKYDSRDVSMQAIGFIDLEDFNLIPLKKEIEGKYGIKIWNDLYFDIRAKFDKQCVQEL